MRALTADIINPLQANMNALSFYGLPEGDSFLICIVFRYAQELMLCGYVFALELGIRFGQVQYPFN